MNNMDYFNVKTNEDFIKFFLDDLYSKMEFEYTHDYEKDGEFEPDYAYGDHIIACQDKLKDSIKSQIKAENPDLNIEEQTNLFDSKKEEIFRELMPEIEIYITKIKVDYK